MIKRLRTLYTKQNRFRGVTIDRLLQKTYARWLSIRKKGKVFTVFTEISSKCNIASGLEKTYYSNEFNNIRSTFYKKMPAFCKGRPHYRKL